MNIPLWLLTLTDSARRVLLASVDHALAGAKPGAATSMLEDIHADLLHGCERLSLPRLDWAIVHDAVTCWQVANAEDGIDRERVKACQAVLGELEFRRHDLLAAAGWFRRATRLTELKSEQAFLNRRYEECLNRLHS